MCAGQLRAIGRSGDARSTSGQGISSTICLDPLEVETRLDRVLHDHHAEGSGLAVSVIATPVVESGAEVQLRVVRPNGDVGLDRQYTLVAKDCASAPQLLALGLDRWLT